MLAIPGAMISSVVLARSQAEAPTRYGHGSPAATERRSPRPQPVAQRRRPRPRSSHPLAPRRRACRAASRSPPGLRVHLSPRDRRSGKRGLAQKKIGRPEGGRLLPIAGLPDRKTGRGNPARTPAAPPTWRRGAVTLQIGGDGAERGRQIGADGAEHGDGGNRDQSSNQTVLDGGGAVIITQQTIKESHLHSLLGRVDDPRKPDPV